MELTPLLFVMLGRPFPAAAAMGVAAVSWLRIVDWMAAISSAAEMPLPATSPMASARLDSGKHTKS